MIGQKWCVLKFRICIQHRLYLSKYSCGLMEADTFDDLLSEFEFETEIHPGSVNIGYNILCGVPDFTHRHCIRIVILVIRPEVTQDFESLG